ncbi:hypothetical protein ANN_20833, partial [Periplaneta americana]
LKTGVRVPVTERIFLRSTHPSSHGNAEVLHGNICISVYHNNSYVVQVPGDLLPVRCKTNRTTGTVAESVQFVRETFARSTKHIQFRGITDVFQRYTRIFRAPNAYIVTLHLARHVKRDLVTKNQFLNNSLPPAAFGDVCVEYATKLAAASAIPSSRDDLHHDNTPAHLSLLVSERLAQDKISVLPQPQYSPDLAPEDFYLFPKVESLLKGRRFAPAEEVKIHATYALRPTSFSSTGMGEGLGNSCSYNKNMGKTRTRLRQGKRGTCYERTKLAPDIHWLLVQNSNHILSLTLVYEYDHPPEVRAKNVYEYGPKRLVKTFVSNVALYGAETWTLRRSEEKRIEAFEMWIWRRMKRVKWTDRIGNKALLERVGEERMMLKLIRKRERNCWITG